MGERISIRRRRPAAWVARQECQRITADAGRLPKPPYSYRHRYARANRRVLARLTFRNQYPKTPPVHPTVTAARRSRAAARLLERRVRAESTLPPEILLLGARQSHEVKCLALGHAERLVPHSPTSLRARYGPRPWIWVRSTPRIRCSASRAGKAKAFGCFVQCLGDGIGDAGGEQAASISLRAASICTSQAATLA